MERISRMYKQVAPSHKSGKCSNLVSSDASFRPGIKTSLKKAASKILKETLVLPNPNQLSTRCIRRVNAQA